VSVKKRDARWALLLSALKRRMVTKRMEKDRANVRLSRSQSKDGRNIDVSAFHAASDINTFQFTKKSII